MADLFSDEAQLSAWAKLRDMAYEALGNAELHGGLDWTLSPEGDANVTMARHLAAIALLRARLELLIDHTLQQLLPADDPSIYAERRRNARRNLSEIIDQWVDTLHEKVEQAEREGGGR